MSLRTALAFTAAMLIAGAAHAGPAEEVASVLDDAGPGLAYGSVDATEDGGVAVRNLTATSAFLLGLTGEEGRDPAASPVALSIDSIVLSEGTVALLLGTSSGAEIGPARLQIDGYHWDLAVMEGSREVDLLRQYLAADAIDGAMTVSVEDAAAEQQQVLLEIALDPIGALDLRLEFDVPGNELPSGEVRITDTPGRGVFAVGAYLQRLALEMALDWAQVSAEAMTPDAPDSSEIEAMREELAALPATGAEAAAGVAEWARGMAAALPEHAGVMEALAGFAAEPGTLTVTYTPPDPLAELIYDMSAGPDLDPTPEQVAATIETLGITAEFVAAE